MRSLRLLLMFALFASFCSAGYVYGDIYQDNLEKLNNTVIRVEGPFSYQLVTGKGNYSIFLPEGEYKISASSLDSDGSLALYAEEVVKVGDQDQKVDLVLKKPNTDYLLYLGALALLAIVFLWSNHHWHARKQGPETKVQAKQELDTDAKRVLKVLESFEGRATQKEIKEALGFSDSKLSLILTELEQLGHIKKFKRGRANIVKKLN